MARFETDRNLLFGLLALQNGLIDKVMLVAAFQSWTLDKGRPLADHLVARGDLDADDRSAVDALVVRHLKKHGQSAEKSLAAIPAGPSLKQSLLRIADPDIGTSLASLGPETDGDGTLARTVDRTAAIAGVTLDETDPGPQPMLVATDQGAVAGFAGRYQVLGEIARGGMGAVLRGRDPSLGRDLALKVLLDQHRDRSDLVDRFMEEAQICGQLQHPGVATALAVAVDDWAAIRRDQRKNRAGAASLSALARAADPDAWRNGLRDALDKSDKGARLAALREQARSALYDTLGPVSMDLLGHALSAAGDPAAAETVLRRAQQRYADDVWINYDLAQTLEKLARREEAIRYYTAARSLRPELAHELAHALVRKGESDEGIAVFEDLRRLRPRNGRHLGCLGTALKARGRSQEANAVLEAAAAANREAVRLRPDDANAHFILGIILRAQGKLDEAIAEDRIAIRLKPDVGVSHHNLGLALVKQGKLDEAIAEYRTAIRLQPDYATAHIGLGAALVQRGKRDEAIAEFRTAIRFQPDDATAYNNLGVVLQQQGKRDEAIAEFRTAIRLQPDLANAHNNLGWAFDRQGKRDEAIAEFRAVIRIQPDNISAHNNLGWALDRQGKRDEAIAEFRTGLRLQPDDAFSHNGLAWATAKTRDLDSWETTEALEHALTAVALSPVSNCYNTLALVEYRARHWAESIAAAERSIALSTSVDASNWFFLALALWKRGERDRSRSFFDQAVAWTRKNGPKNSELLQFWREAAALLKQPGPDGPPAELPANPFAPGTPPAQ